LYTKLRLAVCPQCEAEEEKEIFQLQRYLRDNRNASLIEVSDALDIYMEDIERWIQEKRVSIEVCAKADLTCTICGDSILSGRVCVTCRDRLGLTHVAAGERASGTQGEKDESSSRKVISGWDRPTSTSGSVQKYRRT
jgi:ribosomal protein L32